MFILCDVCFGLTGRQDSTIEIILEKKKKKKDEENEKKIKRRRKRLHDAHYDVAARRQTDDW